MDGSRDERQRPRLSTSLVIATAEDVCRTNRTRFRSQPPHTLAPFDAEVDDVDENRQSLLTGDLCATEISTTAIPARAFDDLVAGLDEPDPAPRLEVAADRRRRASRIIGQVSTLRPDEGHGDRCLE